MSNTFSKRTKTFLVLSVQTQMDAHKTFYPFYATKKMPNVMATVVNSVPSKT